LKEEDAWPAQPQDAYGLEKLYIEEALIQMGKETAACTRIARFHNIFGPMGTWDGERAKAPAAACRKVAIAKLTGNPEVEIWGDGKATRSFCYIDDCLEGIYRLMHSNYPKPLNIGSDYMVTIGQLYDMVADIAGIKIIKKYVPGPQGVRGRNSDNARLRRVLGWEPKVSLEEGLKRTYIWIEEQVKNSAGAV
jgi:nucleoside-diphosphate-sugar epimerase